MTDPIEVNLPDGIDPRSTLDTGGLSWDDREFVKQALKSAGATVSGSGFGCGEADVDFEINGKRFNVALKLRNPTVQTEPSNSEAAVEKAA